MRPNAYESGQLAKRYVTEKLTERHYTVKRDGAVLSVTSLNGRHFTVRVASLSKSNPWIVADQEEPDSYYVLVFKPEGAPPDFFVMNYDEMKKEKEKHQRAMRRPVNECSNPDMERKGLSFEQPFNYRDNWDTLPA
jgi:hypothetical protein